MRLPEPLAAWGRPAPGPVSRTTVNPAGAVALTGPPSGRSGQHFTAGDIRKGSSQLRQLLRPGSPSGRSYRTHPSMPPAAAIRPSPDPGNPAFGIRYSGCGLPCPVQDLLLVLGLPLRFVAVEGGGSIVLIWKPARGGGGMPSRGSSKCRVADRDGPVCCWRRWRGAGSASPGIAW